MSSQLDEWKGEFGEAYTRRNIVDWRCRIDGFAQMLAGIEPGSVLEVGCNRGHNLVALRELGWQVRGVEPQRFARRLAHKHHLDVRNGSIYRIPAPDQSVDLILTSGVLIHVPPDRLTQAIVELARVSKQWLLTIDYHATRDTEILYRGHQNMLWKRNFRAHLAKSLPAWAVSVAKTAPSGFEDASYVLASRVRSG